MNTPPTRQFAVDSPERAAMKSRFVVHAATIAMLSACSNANVADRSDSSDDSVRCREATEDLQETAKELTSVTNPANDGTTITLEESLARIRNGQEEPQDRVMLNGFVRTNQIVVDNPKCFRPGEVAQAKQDLRNLKTYP